MPKKTAAIAVALVCVLSTYPTLAQAPPADFEPNFREAELLLPDLSIRYIHQRIQGTTSPTMLDTGAMDIENDRVLQGDVLLTSRSLVYSSGVPILYGRFHGDVGLVIGSIARTQCSNHCDYDVHFFHVWIHERSGWRLLVAHLASLAPAHRIPSFASGGPGLVIDSDMAEHDQVKAMEQRRLEALADRRYGDYRRLFGSEYVALTQSGSHRPTQIFEDLAGGMHFVNDLDVRVVGPVAIVRGREGDGPYRLRFTRVWVRRAREYVCVAEALTPAPSL